MLSQRLRHRVDIQRMAETATVDGEPTGYVWVDYAVDVPAELVPLSGRELLAASAEQRDVTTRCMLRIVDGISPSMRLIHEDRAHNILSVIPDPTYGRHLTLLLSEGLRYDSAQAETEIDGGDAESSEADFIGGGGA